MVNISYVKKPDKQNLSSSSIVKNFDDFIIGVYSGNEITIQVKSYMDNGKRIGLESKVEQAVYNYNSYNPGYIL